MAVTARNESELKSYWGTLGQSKKMPIWTEEQEAEILREKQVVMSSTRK